MKPDIEPYIPGLLRTVVIGVPAFFLAPYIPYTNGIVLGLLLGILFGNILPVKKAYDTGTRFISGRGMETSILFLSFSINYRHFGELGTTRFVWLIGVLILVLLVTPYLARRVRCPGHSGILIGFGTAICGSSAVAALSAQARSNKDDTGVAIAVTSLLGTAGMLLIPMVLPYFHLSPADQGFILGGSLHAVGNVAGAAFVMGPETGEAAITIKLARVAMLTPCLLLMHFLAPGEVRAEKVKFRLPWYLWCFIVITIVNSLVSFPPGFLKAMHVSGEFILTLAMTAIGLQLRLGELVASGKRGLAFGVIIFGVQILLLVAGVLVFAL